MRTLVSIAQLVVITVIAISVMREFKHAETGRTQRLELLQSLVAAEQPQPDCVIALAPLAPTT